MSNLKVQIIDNQVAIVGTVLHENGTPAANVTVALDGFCKGYAYKYKYPLCKSCKYYKKIYRFGETTTNEKGEFLFHVKNKNLYYEVKVIERNS